MVTLLFTYYYVKNLLTASLVEQGKILAGNVSELAAEKLIENDIIALKSMIEKYKQYSNIEYILIEDFNYQIKTDTYNGNVPKEILRHNVSGISADNRAMYRLINISSRNIEVYDIVQPIKEGLLGFVRVGMKKSYVDSHIRETILHLSFVFLIGTFLAIILALFIITLQITRPITYLTHMAENISLGEFDKPVRLKVKNEIGVLANAIERMRESLKTAMERLQKR